MVLMKNSGQVIIAIVKENAIIYPRRHLHRGTAYPQDRFNSNRFNRHSAIGFSWIGYVCAPFLFHFFN
jgi:hypothetical protein